MRLSVLIHVRHLAMLTMKLSNAGGQAEECKIRRLAALDLSERPPESV